MADLSAFIHAHAADILQPYLDLVRERVVRYSQVDPATFPANTQRMLDLLPKAAADPLSEEIVPYVNDLVRQRLPAGFQLTDILEAMFLYKELILPLIFEHAADDGERQELVAALDDGIRNVALRFCRAFVDLQVELLEKQREAVLELSTPVINVWDGILALPLIGTVDTHRARQIMEVLLSSVARERASIVLLDITGVPVVDTNVAGHLFKTIRAAELLGTECLLVGIGPELAQTIVALGVDLRSITSTADMRQGLTLAFQKLGLKVSSTRRA